MKVKEEGHTWLPVTEFQYEAGWPTDAGLKWGNISGQRSVPWKRLLTTGQPRSREPSQRRGVWGETPQAAPGIQVFQSGFALYFYQLPRALLNY